MVFLKKHAQIHGSFAACGSGTLAAYSGRRLLEKHVYHGIAALIALAYFHEVAVAVERLHAELLVPLAP